MMEVPIFFAVDPNDRNETLSNPPVEARTIGSTDSDMNAIHIDVRTTLSLYSYLMHPISSNAGIVECYVERVYYRDMCCHYNLYLEDEDIYLMSAKRYIEYDSSIRYVISMNEQSYDTSADTCLGSIISDRSYNKYDIYVNSCNNNNLSHYLNSSHKLVGSVQYSNKSRLFKNRNPRRMNIVLDKDLSSNHNNSATIIYEGGEEDICESQDDYRHTNTVLPSTTMNEINIEHHAIHDTHDVVNRDSLNSSICITDNETSPDNIPHLNRSTLLSSPSISHSYSTLSLVNKTPRFNTQLNAYVLNFHGRVTQASTKNFQLIYPGEIEDVLLQFGRIGKHKFTMDVQHPLSLYQAFAIALSSF